MHYLKVLYFLISVVLSTQVYAQIEFTEEPKSFKLERSGIKSKNDLIPNEKVLHNVNNDIARKYAEDVAASCSSCRVDYYGKGVAQIIDVKKESKIIDIASGKLYLLKLHSNSAKGFQFLFKEFMIPEGGQLHFYTPDKTYIYGAYTHRNNGPIGKFATRILPGNDIIIEYFEPHHSPVGKLLINKFVHVFQDLTKKSFNRDMGFEESGNCTINSGCFEEFREESNGVVLRAYYNEQFELGGFCSGAMVNSTEPNEYLKSPYYLTAEHCVKRTDPDDVEVDGNYNYYYDWIFYFNYESEGCSNPSYDPIFDSKTLRGGYLKSLGKQYAYDNNGTNIGKTDYALLELADKPQKYFPVTYLGWDRRNLTSGNVINISHPRGDIKKIAISNDFPNLEDNVTACNSRPLVSYEVFWDSGVTQSGSSGSPLLSNEGRIIGILHGGISRCVDSHPELCSENGYINGPDAFSRFSYAWDHPTMEHSEMYLFLDPLNTNTSYLNHYLATPEEYEDNPGGGGACVARNGTDARAFKISFEDTKRKHFGESVDIDGKTIVSSAPEEHMVYIYQVDDCEVVFQSIITRPLFRRIESVAIWEDYIAIGETSNLNGLESVVSIYKRFGSSWEFQQEFYPTSRDEWFGYVVKLKNGYLVTGSPEDNNGKGAIYIYKLQNGSWGLDRKLISPFSKSIASFGSSLDFDGNTVAVGCRDEYGKLGVGRVYIYNQVNGVWSLQATIKDNYYRFGNYVSINGKYLTVNSKGGNTWSTENVKIYTRIGNTFNKTQDIIAGNLKPDDTFANKTIRNVTLDTKYAVLQYRDREAFLFELIGNQWQKKMSLNPTSTFPRSEDEYAGSVSFSNGKIVIGSPEMKPTCTSSGSIYVFDLFSLFHEASATFCNETLLGKKTISAENITLGGTNCSLVIKDNGQLIANASNKIILKDGFRALKSGSFVARADNCSKFSNGNFTLTRTKPQLAGQSIQTFEQELPFMPDNKFSISIYPNPSPNGKFKLDIGSHDICMIEVFNMNGSKVMVVDSIDSDYFSLDLSSQLKGLYIIRITTNDEKLVRKVLFK